MKDHAHIEELIGIGSLGGLEPEDIAALEREMAEHGRDCEECRLLEDEYAEVAGRLAFALAPAELRAGLEDEVVAAATGKPMPERVPSRPTDTPAPASLEARRTQGRRRAAGVWWRGIAAAAAAAVLFFGGWLVRDLTAPSGTSTGSRVVAFQGDAGDLAVAYRPGNTGAYLFGAGLPSPGPGHVLEVWMIQGRSVTSGACVTPSGDGSLAAYLDAELGSTEKMAVTVEPKSCPSAPTTNPILTADLTAPATA
jgi:anti-sigma-K factor RskA